MNPDYIETLSDYKVDLDNLVSEYNTVQNLLAERKRPYSPVLIQKAMNLVVGSKLLDILESLPYTLKVVKYLISE